VYLMKVKIKLMCKGNVPVPRFLQEPNYLVLVIKLLQLYYSQPEGGDPLFLVLWSRSAAV
jgi:hypothetical protein